MNALGLFQPMDGGDIGMIQRRQHARFPLETGQSFRIVDERGGKNLNRHIAPKLRVVRLVHLTHAACANLRDDLIRAELCTTG